MSKEWEPWIALDHDLTVLEETFKQLKEHIKTRHLGRGYTNEITLLAGSMCSRLDMIADCANRIHKKRIDEF